MHAVHTVAQSRGVPMAQVALGWLLSRPVVSSVILGARTTTQLVDNLGAVDLELGEVELAALDAASDPGAADYPYGAPGLEQRTRTVSGGRG